MQQSSHLSEEAHATFHSGRTPVTSGSTSTGLGFGYRSDAAGNGQESDGSDGRHFDG